MISSREPPVRVPESWSQQWMLAFIRDYLWPRLNPLPIVVVPRTLYMSNAGDDRAFGGASTPVKTLRRAGQLLRPGDTLVIATGTYSGADNTLSQNTIPPGEPDGWITLQAETRGGVIFTSQLEFYHVDEPVRRYLVLDGIIWNKTEIKRFNTSAMYVKNCGFRGGNLSGNYHTVSVGGGNSKHRGAVDVLFEDCWAWGPGGRYKFIAYNAKNVIFRRCVSRWDQGWNQAGFESADIVVYDSENVRVQNCISIDSLRPSVDPDWYTTSLKNEANYYRTDDIRWQGCIVVNNQAMMLTVNGLSGSAIGYPVSGSYQRNQRASRVVVEHCAGAKIGSSDHPDGITVYKGLDTLVCNSTVADLNHNGIAFKVDSLTRNSGGARVEDCVAALDGTGTGFSGGAQRNVTSYSSLAAAASAGLTYLPMPDAGSTIELAWQGAHILYRIGMTGAMWGDPGMEAWGDGTEAGNSLWPFPNEDLIKTCMSAAGGFGDTDRDWTAGSLTLTEYVWSCLGTAAP